jgi:hypothetical protein
VFCLAGRRVITAGVAGANIGGAAAGERRPVLLVLGLVAVVQARSLGRRQG